MADPGKPSPTISSDDHTTADEEVELDDEADVYEILQVNPNPGRVMPPRLAPLPDFPPGCDFDKYYYVLGWPKRAVEKRLEIHLRHSRKRAEAQGHYYPLQTEHAELPVFDCGILELRARTRYNHIYDYDVVPVDCEDPEKAETMQIVTIYHTYPPHAQYRPEFMVYMWISTVFGQTPQWYKDPVPRDSGRGESWLEYGYAPPKFAYYLQETWQEYELVMNEAPQDESDEGKVV
ncbi:hypothetical protein C8Q79DRAFT_924832 [Trametes meyenii]|nr:hypothetical protein C8Q79DRAFT_924832 [Trametes meyenii]